MGQPVGQTVGMIGLGLMGTAMSRNLMAAGFGVAGYDLLRDKLQYLVSAGGRAAGSAAESEALERIRRPSWAVMGRRGLSVPTGGRWGYRPEGARPH